jgi:uncharacterized protein YbjT (DUF2867 family)
MKIAITTPTGHIGSKVAESLIDAGVDVNLLVRDPSKVERLTRRGARAYAGSLDDASFVTEATRGTEALLWVTPPNPRSENLREFQRACGRAAAQAIRISRIRRVVNISSIGAHLGTSTGPINGLYDVERLLDEAAENVTHLRPGFFYENFLGQVDAIREQGKFYLPISGTRRIPMLATRDIARVATDRLLDVTWTGRSVRGLHGPADLTFNEAAEELSRGLGHTIQYVQVPEEPVRQHLRAMGMSEEVTELMLEMFRGMDQGTLKPAELRTTETTTPMTLREFAHEVIVPALAEPVGSGV